MNSFEIFLDEKLNLVRIIATGIIDCPNLEKMIDAARKTAVEKEYNILYDVRLAQTKVSIGNWFFIPRNLEIFRDSRAQKSLAVILTSTEDKGIEGYKFYANVLGNLGFRIRVSYDEKDAIKWLTDSHWQTEHIFDS